MLPEMVWKGKPVLWERPAFSFLERGGEFGNQRTDRLSLAV
jgi:hypothetical protein